MKRTMMTIGIKHPRLGYVTNLKCYDLMCVHYEMRSNKRHDTTLTTAMSLEGP